MTKRAANKHRQHLNLRDLTRQVSHLTQQTSQNREVAINAFRMAQKVGELTEWIVALVLDRVGHDPDAARELLRELRGVARGQRDAARAYLAELDGALPEPGAELPLGLEVIRTDDAEPAVPAAPTLRVVQGGD